MSTIKEAIIFENQIETIIDKKELIEILKDRSISIGYKNKKYKFKESVLNCHSNTLFHIYFQLQDFTTTKTTKNNCSICFENEEIHV